VTAAEPGPLSWDAATTVLRLALLIAEEAPVPNDGLLAALTEEQTRGVAVAGATMLLSTWERTCGSREGALDGLRALLLDLTWQAS
jgi:hypothetical protein